MWYVALSVDTVIIKYVIYVHRQTQQYIFVLLATSFGHYSCYQTNIVQSLKKKSWLLIVCKMLRYMGSHLQ